jgi:hypothetical protein
MKKRLVAILIAMAIAVAVPTSTFAAEVDTLPGPSTTPASGLYFMETWMQHMSLRFTFGAEARLQKALRYAGEKLAEMEAMAEQNQAQRMERAANEYRYHLNIANQNMEQAMNGENGSAERVANMMARHIAAMTRNQNSESEEGQQIRTTARLQAEECQESAVRALACQNAEEAIRLNLALMKQQRERIQDRVSQATGEEIEEALRQVERYQAMNREMMAESDELGLGPEACQMLQQAVATQEEVLNQFRNQFQYGGGEPVDVPLQNQSQEPQGTVSGSGAANTQSASGPMGPAPNSGDGVSDGSGLDSPNGRNGRS